MPVLVSRIETLVFIALVIVALVAIGGLFFVFLNTDDRQSKGGGGKPDPPAS